MCAKFGCGPTVVSKRGGVQTDRQTDRQTNKQRETAALYNIFSCYTAAQYHQLLRERTTER